MALARHNSNASGTNKRSRSYQDDPRAFPVNGMHNPHPGWGAPDVPGAPGSRGGTQFPPISSGVSAALGLHNSGVDDGDENPDGLEEADDGRTYCLCNGPSHGEMIACDYESCEREWVSTSSHVVRLPAEIMFVQFHLACLGMISPPEGSWFCDMCKQKRAAVRRGGRGGKRKATGRGK
jgi:inhibitor of growth protein 3